MRAMKMSAGTTGHAADTGGTPLLGSPGMVLPVTVDVAVSLAGFGSAGVVTVRVAVLVTGVDPVTVAVIRSVAVAPKARAPRFQSPLPAVYVPWLGLAETNVSPAGSTSVTTTLVAGSAPRFCAVIVNVTLVPTAGFALF